MNLNDKSGSRDIAQHVRSMEGQGSWLHPPRPARKPRPFPVLPLALVGFAIAGLVAGYAFGEVPPDYEPPRGYEACTGLC
jgi:hypothetical protein